jgi:uncharacterized protein with HEPN domain
MKDRDIKAISRMIDHIDNILLYTQAIRSPEDFDSNQLVADAVVFNLSQIGEIAKHRVSSRLKDTYAAIPWHEMYGFRNRIVHDYDQINMLVVYETISEDIPALLLQLIELMKSY